VSSHIVRSEVVWSVLGMEAAVAMPIIALTALGEGSARLVWTLVLLLLLPAGYVAVQRIEVLRDPAWRVLAGFALVVLLRFQAPLITGEGAGAAMARFLQAIVPAGLAFALWWRGGSFVETELTATDVHLEFLLGGGALLVELVIFHGIVSVDPQILIWSAGLFAVCGLVAAAMARQDAADAVSLGGGRTLATSIALLPIGATIGLLLVLRPEVMGAMWLGLARLIELALMPLLLLLSWLASLLPAGGPPGDIRPPFRPPQRPPNLDALARQQAPPDWIPWVAATLVLLLVLFMAAGILRLLLESELVVRAQRERPSQVPGITVERSGGAGQDVRQLVRWLARWLRARWQRDAGAADRARAGTLAADDAWAAYKALLEWANEHGIRRRPSETTHQLQDRLVSVAPEAAETVGLVTSTYEWERYGEVHPPGDRLRRIQAALRALVHGPPGA
jgi:Domain of unknown function (DUF4129)